MIKNQISIIVPVHNIEQYLDKCLKSLTKQTYKNIEIIIVNDHSEDNSAQVLKRWQKEDNRITVLECEERGVSAARNFGIDHAKGEFIMFCDGDDYYEIDTCQSMIESVQTTSADIAICDVNFIYHTHQEKRIADEKYSYLKYTGTKKIAEIEIPEINVYPVNKIFHKQIIDKYNIRFPLGRYYEDTFFSYAYLYSCKTITFVQKYLYNYIRREGSTMSVTWSAQDSRDTSIDHIYVIIELYHYLKNNNLFTENSQSFWQLFYLYEARALSDCKSKKSKKQILLLIQDFITKNQSDFNLASEGIQNNIIILIPKMRWSNPSIIKRLVLNFFPTYGTQVHNIEKLTYILEQNNQSLKDLDDLIEYQK